MEALMLATVDLTYTSLESLDYSSGGQLYGTMDGSVTGERLNGTLRLTNLAPRRPDNVNLPTLRGVLTTYDGARAWVEIDGIATLRTEDGARVFVTACRFRTGDERYEWLNTLFGLLEGVLDSVGVGGVARAQLFECRPTISWPSSRAPPRAGRGSSSRPSRGRRRHPPPGCARACVSRGSRSPVIVAAGRRDLGHRHGVVALVVGQLAVAGRGIVAGQPGGRANPLLRHG